MTNTTNDAPRKGPGRPPTGKPRRVKLAITLDPELLVYIDRIAVLRKESRSMTLEAMLRRHRADHDTEWRP